MIVIEVEKEEREIERRLEKEEEEDTHSPPANNNKKMHVPVRLSIPMRGTSIFQSRRQHIQPAIHGGSICAVKASVKKHTHKKKNRKSMGTNSNKYQKKKISTLRDQRRASKKDR